MPRKKKRPPSNDTLTPYCCETCREHLTIAEAKRGNECDKCRFRDDVRRSTHAIPGNSGETK